MRPERPHLLLLLLLCPIACTSLPGGQGSVSLEAYHTYFPDKRDYLAFRAAHPDLLIEPNYLAFMVHRFRTGSPEGDALVLCRWPDERMPIGVYVESPEIPGALQDEFSPREPEEFVQAALHALDAWEDELEGVVRFERVQSPGDADLLLRLVGQRAPTPDPEVQVLGATAALRHACRSRGWDPDENRMRVRFAVSELVVYVADRFGLLTSRQVEGVAMHEIGHALGMRGHSSMASDLMYPVVRDRIVEKLSAQDINSFVSLYRIPNGSHYGWVPKGDPAPPAPSGPPSGAPMLSIAPHVDARFGFALHTPADWIGVETQYGFFAANGPHWDHDASIEIVVRPDPTIEEFLGRFGATLFAGSWLRYRAPMVVNGRRALQIAVEDSQGRYAEEFILVELGDGRVMMILTQCPVTEAEAWQPWLRASLASLEIWTRTGALPAPADRQPSRRRSAAKESGRKGR